MKFLMFLLAMVLITGNVQANTWIKNDLAKIDDGAKLVYKELDERKQNDSLSCDEIAAKASEVLSKNIFKEIDPQITYHNKAEKYMDSGRDYVGRRCVKRQVELGGCIHIYEKRAPRERTAYRVMKTLNYSEACYKSDSAYALRVGENSGNIDFGRTDENSEGLRSKYKSDINNRLSHKIYINVSSEKLNSCRTEINKALKLNAREACYSHLIQQDWNVSVFEASSKLKNLSQYLGFYKNTLKQNLEYSKSLKQTLK